MTPSVTAFKSVYKEVMGQNRASGNVTLTVFQLNNKQSCLRALVSGNINIVCCECSIQSLLLDGCVSER